MATVSDLLQTATPTGLKKRYDELFWNLEPSRPSANRTRSSLDSILILGLMNGLTLMLIILNW